MAYKVKYGISRHEKKSRGGAMKKFLPVLLAMFLLLGAALATRQDISFDWLLPGDPRVTAAALENLREDLASGEPLGEAVTAFCREIIDGSAAGD